MEEIKVNVRGVNLSVKIQGEGIPFLWLHGLMNCMDCDSEVRFINFLTISKKVKLVRMDLRGHGASEASFQHEDYLWKNMAKDVIGVTEALNLNEYRERLKTTEKVVPKNKLL